MDIAFFIATCFFFFSTHMFSSSVDSFRQSESVGSFRQNKFWLGSMTVGWLAMLGTWLFGFC